MQIIQVQADEASPGLFSLWVVAGDGMWRVPLRVPRTFYINTRAPVEGDSGNSKSPGTLVFRKLPHARPLFNLRKVSAATWMHGKGERTWMHGKGECTWMCHEGESQPVGMHGEGKCKLNWSRG